jgi:Tfp pilus assembly protein PilX
MTTSDGPRRNLLSRLGARAHDDDGVALILVVGSMLILAMLAMTALAYTISSQKFARHSQDYSAAVTASQSGVEDFVSRLNRNDSYGQVVDCTNPAWAGPMPAASNPCSWGPGTAVGWSPVVPGDTNPLGAQFHYSVNSSTSTTTGTIVLTATGRVNGVYRTTETTVAKGSSADYVYYTNFESADPSNVQAYTWTPPLACGGGSGTGALKWYAGRSAVPNPGNGGCVEIQFAAGDVLDGPVFSNDAILSNGASFEKGVLTANPPCRTITPSTWINCLRTGSSSSTNFNLIKPLIALPLYLPDNSSEFVTDPGCHYSGSTRVVFSSTGTVGKMTVWNGTAINPNAAPVAIPAWPGGPVPYCGTPATLQSAAGETMDVPNDMVIYAGPQTGTTRQCRAGELGGPAGLKLPLGSYTGNIPTGPNLTYTVDTNMLETTKSCDKGNLYVEGTLKGRTTVAADQSVIVTADLVLAGGSTGTDMLGLVATNSVEVMHPRLGTITSTKTNPSCNSNCTYKWGTTVTGEGETTGWKHRYSDPTTGSNNPVNGIQIAGSIQTLQHSFFVQKYNVGPVFGTLLVSGSIGQQWRGIVGTGDSNGNPVTGYLKLYQYDTRLKFTTPPYFPKWAGSQWKLSYSGEINTPTAVRNP